MLDMKRREFMALVGGGGLLLTAKMRRARAQQPGMPVVGFVNAGSSDAPLAAAFRKGLNEVGYSEGQNVTVEYHWLEGALRQDFSAPTFMPIAPATSFSTFSTLSSSAGSRAVPCRHQASLPVWAFAPA
jgi:hypothetical protein